VTMTVERQPRLDTAWSLPPERPGYPAPASLVAARAAVAAVRSSFPRAAGLSCRRRTIAGVDCVEFYPGAPRATVLYFHGGGFRTASCAVWEGFGAHLAGRANVRIVMPDYRVAPEHPFPAALYDAASVWEALCQGPGPLLLGGDSAGGGLAALTALGALRGKGPRPAGLVLLSPWLDLTLGSATFESNRATDQYFSRESAAVAADHYLQGHPADDILASPLFDDVRGLPPTLLLSGGHETLLGDAMRFAECLADAGCTVELHVGAGMQHVWPLVAPDHGETEKAIARIAAFFASIFGAGFGEPRTVLRGA
jgi:monoterpene epsilon-lactone hydrolase